MFCAVSPPAWFYLVFSSTLLICMIIGNENFAQFKQAMQSYFELISNQPLHSLVWAHNFNIIERQNHAQYAIVVY